MPRSQSNKWHDKKRSLWTTLAAFLLVIPFILVSCYVFGQQSAAPSTLQLISIIFRHGDRNPTHFYPTDPHKNPENWPDGLGALTKEGKQRMYKLGRFFRRYYKGFINEKYSPDDIYVISSDHDRCLMSAQLCLAGLYPPIKDQIWNKDIIWQPIPVHTVPRHLDKLIVVKKPCPKYERELNETYSSDYFKQVNSANAELYNHLTEHSGMTVDSVISAEHLFNTLEVEEKLNLKLPEWATRYYKEMKELATLSLSSFTFTATAKRLKGGPLLGDVVKHITNKVLGLLKPNRNVFLYSSHDLTLISLLRALGFEQSFRPEYGASIIFELHQPFDEGDHLVELLYLNDTEQTSPTKLKIPGCEEECKLRDFIKITTDLIPEDWENECQAE